MTNIINPKNFAKLLLLIFALAIAVCLSACTQQKPAQTRADSLQTLKSSVQQNIQKNDSIQAIKDTIPVSRSARERDDFWAKYLY